MSDNIFLKDWKTPFGAIPFGSFKEKDLLPEFKDILELARKSYATLKMDSSKLSFENFIHELEKIDDQVDKIATTFSNLYNAHCSDFLRKESEAFFKLKTQFSDEFFLDSIFFKIFKDYYNKREELSLSPDSLKLLEETYKEFVRKGAELNDQQKTEIKKINEELSELDVRFDKNVIEETNEYILELKDDQLEGLPETFLAQAKEDAKERKAATDHIVTLQFPSFYPFLSYCPDSHLRAEVYKASAMVACKGNEKDNSEVVKRIIELRQKKAKLLGYSSHPQLVLEERMATDTEQVKSFLDELLDKVLPYSKKDFEKVRALKKEQTGSDKLLRSDFSYYARLLKIKEVGFDPEELRPYFSLPKVMEGVFSISKKLFDLEFVKRDDIPTYHEEVEVYEVKRKGSYLGLFYMDLFPRKTKQPGAWMTDFIQQWGERRPHVGIVCNFSKPTQDKPSLLSFGEVTTLYHEFGHALHGLFSNTKHLDHAGASVAWDFVELPSQLMENWCFEKECLDLFAFHYKTGEKIPESLLEKLLKSRNFLEATGFSRQLFYGLIDMNWHSLSEDEAKQVNIAELEAKIRSKTDFFEAPPIGTASTSFGHIFAGGYDAGYYSYKWAEALEADVFETFKEQGIFNPELGEKLIDSILSRGSSRDEMEMFLDFKGRKPDSDALLRRAGMLD